MNAVLVTAKNTNKSEIFTSHSRDNCNNKFLLLRKELEKRKIELKTDNNFTLENADISIFIDNQPEQLSKLSETCKKILVIGESPIINKLNQRESLRRKYDLILTWETNRVDNKKTFWIGCGCSFPENYQIDKWPSRISREGVCMVAGNKSSSQMGELYSERMDALNFFEGKLDGFRLYGNGWNQRNFKGWRKPLNKFKMARQLGYKVPQSFAGKCESKFDCLKKFKFSICYENALSNNGYITEKIFDSMFSGCIPIYKGATNISDFVPEGTFIQQEQFEDYGDLYTYLELMDKDEYDNYQEMIKQYTKEFLNSTFYDANWAKEIANQCTRLFDRLSK